MHRKDRCFLGLRFWRFFEWFLGGFGEAKNLDFRIFCDVFSIYFLKRVSDQQNIAKKRAKSTEDTEKTWAADAGGPEAPGEDKRGVIRSQIRAD